MEQYNLGETNTDLQDSAGDPAAEICDELADLASVDVNLALGACRHLARSADPDMRRTAAYVSYDLVPGDTIGAITLWAELLARDKSTAPVIIENLHMLAVGHGPTLKLEAVTDVLHKLILAYPDL